MAEKFTDDDVPGLEEAPVVPLRPKGNRHLNTVPWQPGQSGNPAGRPRGARSKMSENFLRDLHATWEKHGALALERCAVDDPSGFVRTVASLLPRHVDLNVGVDAMQFVTTFRQAVELLGNEPPLLAARRKRPKVIDAEVIDAEDH